MFTPTSRSTTKQLTFGFAAVLGTAAVVAGAAGVSAAPAAPTTHTLRLTTAQIKDVIVKGVDVATDSDMQKGKTTGYDVTSCVIDSNTHKASCTVAVARSKGLIVGRAVVNVLTGKGSGKVTGGTRSFKGARGTITVAPGSSANTSKITLRYHN
jgi:hypothetical protein